MYVKHHKSHKEVEDKESKESNIIYKIFFLKNWVADGSMLEMDYNGKRIRFSKE
jgi:hypothetical protein